MSGTPANIIILAAALLFAVPLFDFEAQTSQATQADETKMQA